MVGEGLRGVHLDGDGSVVRGKRWEEGFGLDRVSVEGAAFEEDEAVQKSDEVGREGVGVVGQGFHAVVYAVGHGGVDSDSDGWRWARVMCW